MVLRLRSWVAIVIFVANFNTTISIDVIKKSSITTTIKEKGQTQYFRHLQKKVKEDKTSSNEPLLNYYDYETEDNEEPLLSVIFSTPPPIKNNQEQDRMTNQDKVEETIPSSSSSPRSEIESATIGTVSSITMVAEKVVEVIAEETVVEIAPVVTQSPTVKPTKPIYNEMVHVTIVLAYCENILQGLSRINFEDVTATHLRSAVMQQSLESYSLSPFTELRVQVDVKSQNLADKDIGNNDNSKVHLLISFSAFTSFRSILPYYAEKTSTASIVSMIRNGFEDEERLNKYLHRLQKIGDPAFEHVEYIKLFEINGESISYDDTGNANNASKSWEDLISQLSPRVEEPAQSSSSVDSIENNSPETQEQYLDIKVWIIIGSVAGSVAFMSLALILNLKAKGFSGSLLNINKAKLDGNSTSAGSNNSSSSASPASVPLSSVVGSAPEILVQSSGDEISTLGDPIMQYGCFRNGEKGMDERTASINNDYDYLEYALKLKRQQLGVDIGDSIRSMATSTVTDNNHKSSSNLSSDDYTRNTTSDESLGANLKMQMLQMMNNQPGGGEALFFEKDDFSLEEQYNY